MKFQANLQEGNADLLAARCGFRSEIASCLALVGCITITLSSFSSCVLLIRGLNLGQTPHALHERKLVLIGTSRVTTRRNRAYKGFSDFGLVPFDDAPVVTDSVTALIGPQCQSKANPSGVPCHLGSCP